MLVNSPQYSELHWDGLSANYWWKMNVFLFHKWLFEKAVLLWLVLFFKQVATTAVHITEVMNFLSAEHFLICAGLPEQR